MQGVVKLKVTVRLKDYVLNMCHVEISRKRLGRRRETVYEFFINQRIKQMFFLETRLLV